MIKQFFFIETEIWGLAKVMSRKTRELILVSRPAYPQAAGVTRTRPQLFKLRRQVLTNASLFSGSLTAISIACSFQFKQ
jgi:hypothetical protein